jgi:shikimate dehydrogenase
VLGHPVSHSLSPVLQNAAFRAAGIDACYLAFEVLPPDLPRALEGALALGVGGLNVTVPHKEKALAACSATHPVAELVGAANTLVAAPGGKGWVAHNTDVEGFLRAVEEELGFRPAGRRCLILGAGGAARAAAVGLAREGVQEILVANRNKERAEFFSAQLSERTGTRIEAVGLEEAVGAGLGAGDLLVSATPLGLAAGATWPWELERFDPGILAYDMAYGKRETALVEAARALGVKAASGRRMLLHQGAAAFTLWTGRSAPLGAMEEALFSNV